MEFTGFTPETIDFLWGIRFNNNREWFEAHKKQYQETLYMPMKALAQELIPVLKEAPELECKVSRIYRDSRLHPSTPYKESLWICFRRGDLMWGEQPVYFFELTPDKYSYGFLYWFPRPAKMEQFRRQLAENPKPFLAIVEALKVSGLSLSSECYKRPKPCDTPMLQSYFQMKNMGCYREFAVGDRLFTKNLSGDILTTFDQLKPLYSYVKLFNDKM